MRSPLTMSTRIVRAIDSHTEGEPTRVVLDGGPELGTGPILARRERLAAQHDAWRRGIILEPRGSEVLVGALLLPPHDPTCDAAVIFFNNVGVLGMCGHAAIGVVETLRYLHRVTSPQIRLETPVGIVEATIRADASIAIRNVPAFRHSIATVDVPGWGELVGEVAWGGNWFFLATEVDLKLEAANIPALLAKTQAIRQALRTQGVTGRDGAEIDHIELCGPALGEGNHGRNFVLCPGNAYDRSPCGTGTSAKLACLHAAGALSLGEAWRQESILGSLFIGTLEREGEHLIPTIAGRAHITAESRLVFSSADPFCWGISS